jgi:nucleoside-diphosphate-sugar epimerase
MYPIMRRDDFREQRTTTRQEGYAFDHKGIPAVVICPSMIYGKGRGVQPDSDQIPKLAQLSRAMGVGLSIGIGLNRYFRTVYLGDLVDSYMLALEQLPAKVVLFCGKRRRIAEGSCRIHRPFTRIRRL